MAVPDFIVIHRYQIEPVFGSGRHKFFKFLPADPDRLHIYLAFVVISNTVFSVDPVVQRVLNPVPGGLPLILFTNLSHK